MSRTPRLRLLAVTATAAVLLSLGLASHAGAAPSHNGNDARARLHDTMRALWEDHIVWTRQFIVSAATGVDALPDIGPTTDRLIRNQVDIGNALKPFYGDAAGTAVTDLLTDHILIAAQLVTAAKAGDAPAAEAATTAWYANADDIAAGLHRLNPRHWDEGHLRTMMRAHLDRTLEEAVARIQGRYGDDIAAYEAIHADILEMADMLSDGIVAQFPDAFRR